MVLESEGGLTGSPNQVLDAIVRALTRATRQTDIKGWYREGCSLGVIFTELGGLSGKSAASVVSSKIKQALYDELGAEGIRALNLSFHEYPEDSNQTGPPVNSILYPDIEKQKDLNKTALRVKRAMDILGSSLGILLCGPVLLLISILIKMTSKGPVLFRQKRLGQYGRPFTFLKFRSMHFNSDHAVHKEYVTQFIAARNGAKGPHQPGVFKLVRDPRVTRIGGFLRKTSLDELPQLLNVLKGEMSLVGPRPPLPYEFEAYQAWHRRRLLTVKPGITGLWQVVGRSKVTFDEMVRLDLQYAETWSIALDLRILMRTPFALVDGAY